MKTRSVKKAAGALALLWVALSLPGCGGGGGDDGTTTTTTPPPPLAPATGYYLWNVASSNWGLWHWLAVVDPARPGMPKHSLLMTTANGTPATPRTVSATKYDSASRRVTSLGTSRLFFLQQGKVYTLDLALNRNAAPQRLSGLGDACAIWATYALDPSGDDAWAEVETAGADGRCDRYNDNTYVAVRTGMNANSHAAALPAGMPWAMTMLPGARGHALGFLVQMQDHLRFYDTELAASSEVAGSNSTTGYWELGSFGGERKLYVGTWGDGSSPGLSVRALSYSEQAASLGPELMTLQSPQATPQRGDWDTVYFSDRNTLYQLTAGGPSQLAEYAAGDVQQITPTAHHVVTRLYDATAGSWSTWSVARAGGSAFDLGTLENSSAGVQAGLQYVHWGVVAGDRYFYFALGSDGLGSIHSIDADGIHAETWASGVAQAGALYRRTPEAGHWWQQITDLVYCRPQAGRGDCEGGTMTQLNIDTGASTPLGTLPASTKLSRSVQHTFAWGFEGGSIGIGTRLYDNDAGSAAYDLYTATAGAPGSLQAATYNYAAP